uniref:Uncharacterized protein n=1 Tax=Heterorhabditis bacteriophora TaxID=37862 RepID=A0A1I7WU92_HETBA
MKAHRRRHRHKSTNHLEGDDLVQSFYRYKNNVVLKIHFIKQNIYYIPSKYSQTFYFNETRNSIPFKCLLGISNFKFWRSFIADRSTWLGKYARGLRLISASDLGKKMKITHSVEFLIYSNFASLYYIIVYSFAY